VLVRGAPFVHMSTRHTKYEKRGWNPSFSPLLLSLSSSLSSYLLQRMEAREDVEAAVREPRVVLEEDPVQVREPLHDVVEVVILQ